MDYVYDFSILQIIIPNVWHFGCEFLCNYAALLQQEPVWAPLEIRAGGLRLPEYLAEQMKLEQIIIL